MGGGGGGGDWGLPKLLMLLPRLFWSNWPW